MDKVEETDQNVFSSSSNRKHWEQLLEQTKLVFLNHLQSPLYAVVKL